MKLLRLYCLYVSIATVIVETVSGFSSSITNARLTRPSAEPRSASYLYLSTISSVDSKVSGIEFKSTDKGLLQRIGLPRLATLPGFQYFHLMRRVTVNSDDSSVYDEGTSDESAQENYVSFTIWNKKSDFSAWRSGDAFKEAHGGTSITAFLSTMVNSALVLRGAPRPAFYDGLLLNKAQQPKFLPETVDGWRNVEADGINTLPAECFVEMVKFFIPSGEEAMSFEQSWTVNNNQLSRSDFDGFVASTLLRRDGQAKGHGVTPMDPTEPTYVGTTIFQDRKSYELWVSTNKKANIETKRVPETVYYEGTLVISSADGQ